jgi:glycine betaine/proline transport system ATP-binding protein
VSKIQVEIKNLYKIFGANPLSVIDNVRDGASKQELLEKHDHVLGLKDVNVRIPARGIQVIMGLSGSGKSTLIRHINRLIEPTSGEIIVDGRNVLEMDVTELRDFRRFKASMVFQRFGLFPHRTVLRNVTYGLKVQGLDRESRREKARQWVDLVGLSGYEDMYPSELSGGMQQRVGLARALATDADILLMDEAFSALDPLIRREMQDQLIALQNKLHKTIVFITHDLDEALRIGDNIAILRDGSIAQEGSPQDIILNPADDYVADFTKDINRGRVLQVASIMDSKKPGAGPKIERNMVIEDALQVLSNAGATTAIVTHNAKSVGSADVHKMIAALAKPKVGTGHTETYS